ncbi:MAG: Trk system potassium transporter TrkA, partial [Immundisolibacteraceae bacterium]|nr:Trk system potassium transporter TrkA [Immundisolibacteraceae bacterium]
MRVLILGAGQVGSTVAETLVGENNDVTLVDSDADALRAIEDRLDLRVVQGHAANPVILREAGAREADMLLAVTSNDEVNMVACQIAYTLFHTPMKIARIRQQAYLEAQELFDRQAFHVDVLINPEQLVTDYVQQLIKYPGSLQVLDFAGGKVKLVAMRADQGGPMIGSKLAAIREHIPKQDTRVAAIYRDGESVIPNGDTVIQPKDEVFFLAATPDIRKVMNEFAPSQKGVKRVVIAGGGNIGMRLAEALEQDYNVKLIERSPQR